MERSQLKLETSMWMRACRLDQSPGEVGCDELILGVRMLPPDVAFLTNADRHG